MNVKPLVASQGCAIFAASHYTVTEAVAEAEHVMRRHFASRTIADLAQAMVQGGEHARDFRFPPR